MQCSINKVEIHCWKKNRNLLLPNYYYVWGMDLSNT